MSMKKDKIDGIIIREGGYVNDPDDSGGETNYGITKQVARKYGYKGDMKNMPREVAYVIYSTLYWDSLKGDDMYMLSPAIVEEVVDTGVNIGVDRAAKFLQRSLNVLNKKGVLYRDLKIDGDVGEKTLEALAAYLDVRDETTMLTALNCLQGNYYVELAERREKDEHFVYGWLKKRIII